MDFGKKILKLRNVLMFTYDLFISSYVGMVGETLAFISVIIIQCKERIREKSR